MNGIGLDVIAQETDGGVRIAVRARPGASKDAVVGLYGDALKIAVRAAPENGKANDALIKVIASFFGVKPGQVALSRGGSSATKSFVIRGIDAAAARQRIRDGLSD